MKTIAQKRPTVITAIADFISSDFLQKEIQAIPTDLQEIFDLVLDTDAGNCLQTRRKMLRIKELSILFARKVAPFSEYEIQESCKKHQN